MLFFRYLRDESGLNRKNIVDNRGILYFIFYNVDNRGIFKKFKTLSLYNLLFTF